MKPKLLSSLGSQHARRVRVLAHELNLDIDIEEVMYGPQGFGGEQRDQFLALNPNGKVPVLRHGDMVLWESNAIMWYLAELHGDNPLWPSDRRERAQIAMWQVWQAAHVTPAADGLFYENRVKPMFLKQDPDSSQVEQHTQSFHRWMAVMEHYLENADYLALGRFTCADISISAALMQAESSRMPIGDHPRVQAWLERVQARPSWVETEPPPMPGPG
ncbi:MAG: glutathione S-transferase family protein [Deltaproteobacteria bacterium]|nr:glutathione S-transferase family protein [Deltaproteobacteria bacterium]